MIWEKGGAKTEHLPKRSKDFSRGLPTAKKREGESVNKGGSKGKLASQNG